MKQISVLLCFRYLQHRRIGHAASEGGPSAGDEDAALESPNELQVTGIAQSDHDVGLLMSRLGASDLFDDVTLVYSQPVIRENTPAREFRLTCRVPQFE